MAAVSGVVQRVRERVREGIGEASVIIRGRNGKGQNWMKMKREQRCKTHGEVRTLRT